MANESIESEIAQIEDLLGSLPGHRVLEIQGLERRLRELRAALDREREGAFPMKGESQIEKLLGTLSELRELRSALDRETMEQQVQEFDVMDPEAWRKALDRERARVLGPGADESVHAVFDAVQLVAWDSAGWVCRNHEMHDWDWVIPPDRWGQYDILGWSLLVPFAEFAGRALAGHSGSHERVSRLLVQWRTKFRPPAALLPAWGNVPNSDRFRDALLVAVARGILDFWPEANIEDSKAWVRRPLSSLKQFGEALRDRPWLGDERFRAPPEPGLTPGECSRCGGHLSTPPWPNAQRGTVHFPVEVGEGGIKGHLLAWYQYHIACLGGGI